MTVKNEVDIVVDVINSALTWADYIIILDNNSSDGTWECISDLANNNKQVIIWGRYLGKFNDALRRKVYLDYCFMSNINDWWCRLDADEFYIDSPREFLLRLDRKVDFVNSASFQYYITDKDESIGSNLNYKLLSYYKCNWSETRFFRQKKKIYWYESQGWPSNLYFMNDEFIRLKHYQYRNLKQVKERAFIRTTNTSNELEFKHEISNHKDWFINKNFKVPHSLYLIENKVVYSADLTKGCDYKIPNEFKSKFKQSKKNVFKRKISFYLMFFINFWS